MTPGPHRSLPGGWLVRSGLVHGGAARVLVHRLKYEAIPSAASVLAAHMVAALPPDAERLVPVPRTRWRVIRYGVDPALELALELSKASGLPVTRALAPPVFATHHAGRRKRDRDIPRFRSLRAEGSGMVLVDDVVTTGVTLVGAVSVLAADVAGMVTATVSV